MNNTTYQREIRDSIIRELLKKVREQRYKEYLTTIRLEKIRFFQGAKINFDFPVTALIGPNGSGKSTILGVSACIYSSISPDNVFIKSRVGDESMDAWKIEYEIIDKTINPKGTIQQNMNFIENRWQRSSKLSRYVKLFGITRTLAAVDNPRFVLKKKLSTMYKLKSDTLISHQIVENIDYIKREAERILGKSFTSFDLFEISVMRPSRKMKIESRKILEDGREVIVRKKIDLAKVRKVYLTKQLMYVGGNGETSYSEFNFGSGEASVIRMVADIEALPDSSLVLIEEIENGLHPLAVCRLVEYLIDVAKRKSIQTIFTTHSEYALEPLPPEAIWASIDGKLQQGKLSIEVLRAVSGRVDKQLAIFVEDDFVKNWIEAVLREKLEERQDEIGVYPAYGDGNAVQIQKGHKENPSILFHSLCFIDGDSKQKESIEYRIFRLPGLMPESTIFNSVVSNLNNNIALLTVACQYSLGKQNIVADVIKDVSRTNRDPHLLFSQIGAKLGSISEAIVRGAFLSVWIQENSNEVNQIVSHIKQSLEIPPISKLV